jgi:serine O-acetyltransferase
MIKDEVSAEMPDWSREQKRWLSWDPSRSLIGHLRVYQRQASSKYLLIRLLSKLTVLRYRFWTIVTGADIPLNCQIEGGLMLPHPNGIVIHPGSKIGPNCLFFQQVTIGTNEGKGPPQIGEHVDIGAGAKILGDIKIGNHARIGANAVVLNDVQPGATAVGVPARMLDFK